MIACKWPIKPCLLQWVYSPLHIIICAHDFYTRQNPLHNFYVHTHNMHIYKTIAIMWSNLNYFFCKELVHLCTFTCVFCGWTCTLALCTTYSLDLHYHSPRGQGASAYQNSTLTHVLSKPFQLHPTLALALRLALLSYIPRS